MNPPGIALIGLCGALGGLLGPALIARIPEPDGDTAGQKQLYRDIAARDRLGWSLGLAGAVCGGLVGARLGWHGAMLPWAFLVPLGLILAYVDARTRLLPTWVIAPSYGVLLVLVLLAFAWDRSTHHLLGALLGWAVLGGVYFLLWLVHPSGMGYGDVRLSGLLGLALGYLGWPQLVVGGYAGILLGGVGGFLLSRTGLVKGRTVPFGPFLVLGAFIGAVVGAQLVHAMGY